MRGFADRRRVLVRKDTHTHTHAHARTHTHTRACTSLHAHTHTHTHRHTARAHAHRHARARAHTHTHTHTWRVTRKNDILYSDSKTPATFASFLLPGLILCMMSASHNLLPLFRTHLVHLRLAPGTCLSSLAVYFCATCYFPNQANFDRQPSPTRRLYRTPLWVPDRYEDRREAES